MYIFGGHKKKFKGHLPMHISAGFIFQKLIIIEQPFKPFFFRDDRMIF